MRNDKSVKVYVYYFDHGDYEGCSTPETVFLSEDRAKAWCLLKENYPPYGLRDYKELVLE